MSCAAALRIMIEGSLKATRTADFAKVKTSGEARRMSRALFFSR